MTGSFSDEPNDPSLTSRVPESLTGPPICIELSCNDDRAALEAFYTVHAHQNFAYRPEATKHACANGEFVVAYQDRNIVGAAGIFAISPQWVELGQGRVTLPRRGIYHVLIAVSILLAGKHYPNCSCIFAEVDETNCTSLRIFRDMLFNQIEPEIELEARLIASLPFEKRPAQLGYNFVWFNAGAEARGHAQVLLSNMAAAQKDFRFSGSVLNLLFSW